MSDDAIIHGAVLGSPFYICGTNTKSWKQSDSIHLKSVFEPVQSCNVMGSQLPRMKKVDVEAVCLYLFLIILFKLRFF